MSSTQSIFNAIEQDNIPEIQSILDQDPGMVHARHADPDLYHWTTLLLQAGADIHAKDEAGKTALDWAEETKL